ncbi:MAG: hypothetical protein ACSLEW_12725 [Nocardioides sp.]
MTRRARSTVGLHLGWVFIQGTLLMPMFLSGLGDFANYGWPLQAVTAALALFVTYRLARNLVHLWEAPANQADAGSVARLAAVGAWFTLGASGPLFEGNAQAKPLGVVAALLAVNLLALAARDLWRICSRQSKTPSAPSHVNAT